MLAPGILRESSEWVDRASRIFPADLTAASGDVAWDFRPFTTSSALALSPDCSKDDRSKLPAGKHLVSHGCTRVVPNVSLGDFVPFSLPSGILSKQHDSAISRPAQRRTCQNHPGCTPDTPDAPLTAQKRLAAASLAVPGPGKRARHTPEEEQSTIDVGPTRHTQQTSLLNTNSIRPWHVNTQLLSAMPVVPQSLTPCPGGRASIALVPECLTMGSCPCAGVSPCVPEVYHNRALQVVQAQAEKLRDFESLTLQLVEELCMARAQLRTALQQNLACKDGALQQPQEGRTKCIDHTKVQSRDEGESQGSDDQQGAQEDQELSSAESAAVSLETDDLAVLTLSCEDQLCQLCRENAAVTVALPCRHLVLCRGCAPDCLECPRCNNVLQGVLHLS